MIKINFSSVHGDKLRALLSNSKLPETDLSRVKHQIVLYNKWIEDMNGLQNEGDLLLEALVYLLNSYKKTVELDLIFSSKEDFLYRQKGQLKLDNTILEEFLPRLFDARLVPGFARQNNLECGPSSSFAGLSFESPLLDLAGGGAYIKKKNHDFSVTRKHNIQINRIDKPSDRFEEEIYISYFASEIKTNLDKTMFQEAAATANELKRATSGSKYILLCEWLDMKPINTKLTAIDEVIILRHSKRVNSNIRAEFSNAKGRQEKLGWFNDFLDSHPLSINGFKRFIWHLNECFPCEEHDTEDSVLKRGYF